MLAAPPACSPGQTQLDRPRLFDILDRFLVKSDYPSCDALIWQPRAAMRDPPAAQLRHHFEPPGGDWRHWSIRMRCHSMKGR
jgi:hypothetical protein